MVGVADGFKKLSMLQKFSQISHGSQLSLFLLKGFSVSITAIIFIF